MSTQNLLDLAARFQVTPVQEAIDLESWGGEATQ
jgi:hypothetical protein